MFEERAELKLKQKIRHFNPRVFTLTEEIDISIPFIAAGDLEHNIKLASELGYDGVELHWASPQDIPLSTIDRLCNENNLKIEAFATGQIYTKQGYSLIGTEDSRNMAIRLISEYIDMASLYGATVILGCVRGNLDDNADRNEKYYLLSESLKIIANYADLKQVNIVLEPINRYENNYLNSVLELVKYFKNFNVSGIKVLIDTFHMNIEDADFVNSINYCADLIGYVHLADSNRYYPGMGHIPFQDIADALKENNYHGCLSAECLPFPNSTEALENWIKEVNKYF